MSLSDGKVIHKYHGYSISNPDFSSVRTASKAADAKQSYETLRTQPKYSALPAWSSKTQALTALSDWEGGNADACSRQRDDGQFFGFSEVAQGYLGKFWKFIYIPAVRDASAEAEEGRGSAITGLVDVLVRRALAHQEQLQELREEAEQRYRQIIDPSKLAEMKKLETDLNATLRQYAPEGEVHLSWLTEGGVSIDLPKAEVQLCEDGYTTSVARTGHGMQRALILTLLQGLATVSTLPNSQGVQAAVTSSEEPARADTPGQQSPDITLAIEEPELYQHPARQRHLATILLKLAAEPQHDGGVMGKTQVIYSTHSPAFVGVDRFDQTRLFKKIPTPGGGPRRTVVVRTTLDKVAEALWSFHGRPAPKFTGVSIRPRLQPLMTPWLNEGFFADTVVLVEGEQDRAAILAGARLRGADLDSKGISVIPCMGKNNLDRAALIFDSLGIATYIIWDSDEGGRDCKPEFNRCLLRIVGEAEEDYPHAVGEKHACFRKNLSHTLHEEIGDQTFRTLLLELQGEFGFFGSDQLEKNAFLLGRLLEKAQAGGSTSPTLISIVDRILDRRADLLGGDFRMPVEGS